MVCIFLKDVRVYLLRKKNKQYISRRPKSWDILTGHNRQIWARLESETMSPPGIAKGQACGHLYASQANDKEALLGIKESRLGAALRYGMLTFNRCLNPLHHNTNLVPTFHLPREGLGFFFFYVGGRCGYGLHIGSTIPEEVTRQWNGEHSSLKSKYVVKFHIRIWNLPADPDSSFLLVQVLSQGFWFKGLGYCHPRGGPLLNCCFWLYSQLGLSESSQWCELRATHINKQQKELFFFFSKERNLPANTLLQIYLNI